MDSNPSSKKRYHFGKSLNNFLKGYLTTYETPKLVSIHSSKYAVLLRILQIIILIYSIIYLLIYEKGYQKQSTTIISSATLKVKGIGYIHVPVNQTIIIDGADYIIPPSENNAIFIMTNFIQTDQTQSKCAESKLVKNAICTNDSDCFNKPFTPNMNGRWTGRCSLSSEKDIVKETTNITKTRTGLCEYAGWCPAENDLTLTMLVKETLNFTIFIKNFIEFPEFGVKHKNMVDNLQQCTFHAKHDTDCPIFTIDYILNEAEKNITELNLMLRYGGVVCIKLDWDCNLDRNIKRCKPEYSFARLDVPFYENPFSRGFNFRYASYWKRNRKHFRTLRKAFGLRFIITVSGKAGKFDFITLTLNIGSVVGLFGLGTIVCDFILLYLSKRARFYRNHVFEIVRIRTRADRTVKMSKRFVQQHVDESSNAHLNI
ncbi:unnamed protein product [Rotaria sp. Silwood1]|nr:unnamed protein product [Rotaria sp. Silwood1]CAF3688973.1 unnamed protein product [Rotaria sp. Silwood1]CAF3817044.1 unnamed protein product [Rotaria sp. Silwood1]CAF4695932.1 unnamed protein product [Rotaria sp. Silwood1]CAF4942713.1 unnamed protein product [Rotaria sp. Silwood1]